MKIEEHVEVYRIVLTTLSSRPKSGGCDNTYNMKTGSVARARSSTSLGSCYNQTMEEKCYILNSSEQLEASYLGSTDGPKRLLAVQAILA